MPAVSAEFPVDAAARTGVDLRGYRQLRLVVSVGLAGGLAGTVLKLRLDASATWADSGAELALTSTYAYPVTSSAALAPSMNPGVSFRRVSFVCVIRCDHGNNNETCFSFTRV